MTSPSVPAAKLSPLKARGVTTKYSTVGITSPFRHCRCGNLTFLVQEIVGEDIGERMRNHSMNFRTCNAWGGELGYARGVSFIGT